MARMRMSGEMINATRAQYVRMLKLAGLYEWASGYEFIENGSIQKSVYLRDGRLEFSFVLAGDRRGTRFAPYQVVAPDGWTVRRWCGGRGVTLSRGGNS